MIKVKLLAGTHGVYQELINYPPENIKYIYPKLETFHYGKTKMIKRNIISLIFNLFQLPRLAYLSKNQTHLIHSCRGVLILNKKPWIIDFEHIVSTVGYNFNRINNLHYTRIIEKFLSSKYCKKILPWSYAAKQTIFHYLNAAKFKNKIEVIYPAMHKIGTFRKEKSDKIRILFVGHAFLAKGGLDLVEAFKILNKKYDIKLTMITALPKEYNKLKSLPNLNFIPPYQEKTFLNFIDKQISFVCLVMLIVLVLFYLKLKHSAYQSLQAISSLCQK